MSGTKLPPVEPARLEWDEGRPLSPVYRDGYFSRAGGPAESRHVFVEGNHLAGRFAALPPGSLFVLGETGFGTGLNMLLAAACFREHAPAGAHLHLISAECHPLTAADLDTAADGWPELAGPARLLRDQYPPPAPGYHRIRLAANVELTLMLGDAETLWRLQSAAVDAWFLDGFAPDRNPAMWSESLFRVLAARSRPGTTLASFTVAGGVRRGLEAAGFRLQRRPGFGTKRECMAGVFPGTSPGPQRLRSGHVLVAGAGLAGATTAWALAARGWQVTVTDPAAATGQCPGNPAAVVHANPGAAMDARDRFHLAGYVRTLAWLRALEFPAAPGDGALAGMDQHLVDPRRRRRIRQVLTTGAWPEALVQIVDAGRVRFPHAGWISPQAWCRRLLDHPAITMHSGTLDGLPPADAGAGYPGPGGDRADAVVVCVGADFRSVAGLESLRLRLVRGQVTLCRATPASRRWRRVHCHAGYLTPALADPLGDCHAVGATFGRDDPDPQPRASDDRANLEALRSGLPEHWQALGGEAIQVVDHWVGFRCQPPDYLPVCGPLDGADDRRFLNLGHGSRGLTTTVLCAELVADRLSGQAGFVDREVGAALAPARYLAMV